MPTFKKTTGTFVTRMEGVRKDVVQLLAMRNEIPDDYKDVLYVGHAVNNGSIPEVRNAPMGMPVTRAFTANNGVKKHYPMTTFFRLFKDEEHGCQAEPIVGNFEVVEGKVYEHTELVYAEIVACDFNDEKYFVLLTDDSGRRKTVSPSDPVLEEYYICDEKGESHSMLKLSTWSKTNGEYMVKND